jgi:hypothetical protein
VLGGCTVQRSVHAFTVQHVTPVANQRVGAGVDPPAIHGDEPVVVVVRDDGNPLSPCLPARVTPPSHAGVAVLPPVGMRNRR